MAATKLLNLLAISSLAIVACSFGPAPVSALSADSHGNLARHASRGHDAVAKRKRSTNSKRCKTRPAPSSSSVAPSEIASSAVASSKKVDATQAPVAVVAAVADPAPASSTQKAAAAPSTTKAATSKAAAPTAASAPISGGGKVGIAWPNGDDTSIAPFKGNQVSWTYTWSPYLPKGAAGLGLKGVPMLWGPKQVGDFQKLVKQGYATHAMGFNEPNEPSQSNLDPAYAAQLWKQYMQPLKAQGYTLVSPACTNGDSGVNWMKSFLAACDGCNIDRMAIHFYGTSAQDLITYTEKIHSLFNIPIWVTEFACQNFGGGSQCSKDQVFSFAGTIKNYFDNSPIVEAYFPFGAMHDMYNVNPLNQLMKSDGSPTDLGFTYIN